ncbi:MAG: hypothetical protein WCC92_07125 [Candidatus Korobacteraceae bacterium]
MAFSTVAWIRGADRKLVLVDMAFVKRVQVTVMNVIGMPAVEDCRMTTVLAMVMLVVLMNLVLI